MNCYKCKHELLMGVCTVDTCKCICEIAPIEEYKNDEVW